MARFVVALVGVLLTVGCGSDPGDHVGVEEAGRAGFLGEAGAAGSSKAGAAGQAGSGEAGQAGSAGDPGAAGTSGEAGSAGAAQAGQAGSGEAGQAGSAGSSGEAGQAGSGEAGSAGATSPVCLPGGKSCSGQDTLVCDPTGQWEVTGTCVERACWAGSCTGTCEPGQIQCSGLVAQKCDSKGAWEDQETCPFACQDGSCQGACEPGTQQCQDDTVETCGDDFQWASTETCPYGCQDGVCLGECQTGEVQCSGTVPETCGPDGMWDAGQACPFVCQDGACTGECVPGTHKCEGLAAQTCSSNGQWVTDQVCPFVCQAGACQGECVPGSQQCSGLEAQTCSPDGLWATHQTCEAGANQEVACQVQGGVATCQVSCLSGWDDCDGDQQTGCEVDLLVGVAFEPGSPAEHCGVCGHSCGDAGCSEGACGYMYIYGDNSSYVTGFGVTQDDNLWYFRNKQELWFKQARTNPQVGYLPVLIATNDEETWRYGIQMDPATGNPCWVVGSDISCWDGSQVATIASFPYNYVQRALYSGDLIQPDRVMRGFLEYNRSDATTKQITDSTQGWGMTTTPTHNYWAELVEGVAYLYRAQAGSTVKQLITALAPRPGYNRVEVTEMHVRGDYLAYQAYGVGFGVVNLATQENLVLHTGEGSIILDDQYAYFADTVTSLIYRSPLAEAAPIPWVRTGPTSQRVEPYSLQITNTRLYWINVGSYPSYSDRLVFQAFK